MLKRCALELISLINISRYLTRNINVRRELWNRLRSRESGMLLDGENDNFDQRIQIICLIFF